MADKGLSLTWATMWEERISEGCTPATQDLKSTQYRRYGSLLLIVHATWEANKITVRWVFTFLQSTVVGVGVLARGWLNFFFF